MKTVEEEFDSFEEEQEEMDIFLENYYNTHIKCWNCDSEVKKGENCSKCGMNERHEY